MMDNLPARAEGWVKWGQLEVPMHNRHTDEPAWLSDKDKQHWNGEREDSSGSGLIPKPFDSLPETPRSAPAVTNRLPDEL